MIKVLRALLVEIIEKIDAGNSNINDDDLVKIIDSIKQYTDKDIWLSKYEACRYIRRSRASFDNYVREGKLPKGRKQIGFKELSWSRRDLDKFMRENKD